MRAFDPQLAEIRFGYGLSPEYAPPANTDVMLAGLSGPDVMAERFRIQSFAAFRERMVEISRLRAIRRKNRGSPEAAAARKQRNVINKQARTDMEAVAIQSMLRRPFHRRRQTRCNPPRCVAVC